MCRRKMAGVPGMILATIALLIVPLSAAHAQKISEKSVRILMKYALSYTPDRFTRADGTTVVIDRKDPEAIKALMVPIDKASEAVMAARMAAYARVCGLFDDEKNTFISFLTREQQSKKWTPQQIIFLRSLFYTTEMLMVGKVQEIKHTDGGKKVVIREGKPVIKSCTEEQRVKVKNMVAAYLKSGPDLSKVTDAGAAAAPAAATKQ